MTVNVTRDAINVREKLAELDKPTGIAGEAMLRAETPQEQFNLIGAGRRRLTINGDMRIAQRGTSDVFGQSNKGYKTVDRFQFWEQGTPTAVFAVTQESSGGPSGFPYSTKLNCTTANTSGIPTSVHMYMQYNVEAQDMYQLAWGTSDAKPATLSFWAKSNTAGTYVVNFKAYDGSDLGYYTAPYELDGSGTWQYITIHIPANTITNVQNSSANGTGLYILWPIQSSTTYSSGTPLTKWEESPSTSQLEAGQTADVGAAVGNYWQITGVQLELGKVATPFEHRSYGEELALCQRYYEVFKRGSVGASVDDAYFTVGHAVANNRVESVYHYKVVKRAQPTVSFSGTVYASNSTGSGQACTNSNVTFDVWGTRSTAVNFNVDSGTPFNAGDASRNYIGQNSTFVFDAEL